jgi:murein L,D-transpeptidase YafK
MTGWRKAWEARDSGQYLSFYAQDFTDLHRDKSEWSAYKTRVNADKKFIRVDISDVSIMEEPARPELVNVVFMQRYVSDNHRWQGRKQQLWPHDDDGWKIIFEGDYF